MAVSSEKNDDESISEPTIIWARPERLTSCASKSFLSAETGDVKSGTKSCFHISGENGLTGKNHWEIHLTSNNQRLGSAGDNDRSSNGFCSSAVFCVRFRWQMVKTRGGTMVYEALKVQTPLIKVFCAFLSFLVEVQMNAGYKHATHA